MSPRHTNPPRPPWLKVRVRASQAYHEVRRLVSDLKLHTVCAEARCPNVFECWDQEKTATFMILGDVCTRRCMFCSVAKGRPGAPDPDEPRRVAEAVHRLGLRHAVLTQVNRDDLVDEGAGHFAATIRAIRERAPRCRIEVLISDLRGNWDALECLLDARPEVLAHNVECVKALYKRVRPEAGYARSLALLRRAAGARGTRIAATKSSLMVGLGETLEQIEELIGDLRATDVDIFTVGQYLQPTPRHLPIQRFYTPEEFRHIQDRAMAAGFGYVAAGALVRSSYHAGSAFAAIDRLLHRTAPSGS